MTMVMIPVTVAVVVVVMVVISTGPLAVMVIMTAACSMAVAVVFASAQQPRTDQIHGEAERGHRDRLGIDDRDRRDQAQHAFIGNLEGDHA